MKKKQSKKRGGNSFRRKSRRIARRTARRVQRRRGGSSTLTLGVRQSADEQKRIRELFNKANKAPDHEKNKHIANLKKAIDESSAPEHIKTQLHLERKRI